MTRSIKILRFWWWLFSLYVLVSLALLILAYIKMPPRYFSTTKILVTPNTSSALANIYDAPYTDRAVKTVAVLAEGNEINNSVARELNLGVKTVKKSIKIKTIIGTQVIEARVSSTDRQRVLAISRLLPPVLEGQLKNIQKGTSAEEKNQIKISIAEPSTAPEIDTMYRAKVIFFLLVILGVAGYGIFYLVYLYDRSIKKPEDFEGLKLNYLGDFGKIEGIHEGLGAILREKNQLPLETVREVRSGLMLQSSNPRVMAVTSLRPKEGKSTLSASLALILSEIGKRVAVIDADLRAPALNKLFGMPVERGLGDYLEGTASGEEILLQTPFDNLWLIPAGRPRSVKASSLASEDGLKKLIHWLTNVGGIDYLVIDTPPLEACADAALIARLSDGVIVASEYGKTSHRDLKRIRQLIKRLNLKFAGSVLTKTRRQKKYKYYY